MVFEIGPDPLLTCPLDESHRILKSRLQFHLVRCSKNNKLGMRLKCPWNPLHIIDKFAYEAHYTRDCEDMPGAVDFMCLTEEKSRDVGSVPVTATNGLLPPGEEDWDAEPGPVGTYDPTKNAEGKPVLRIAIGLSKAKKKQYRLAERRRFQELEEIGPIQTPAPRSEDPKPAKELRPPLTISKTLSTNTSMMEDLNSTKFSEIDRDGQKDNKEHQQLRRPQKPSSTLSHNADVSSVANGARCKSICSEDGARGLDEVPKLCQSLSSTFHDMSIRSSTSSYNPSEMTRRARESRERIPNLNDSLACFSEAEKSIYLDEPNRVPNLVGPAAEPEVDNILELSQRFAKLETMKKEMENTTAYMVQQMNMYSSELPKLINSTASLNLLDRTHDDGNTDDDIPATEQQRHFLNGLSKCAANFPKLTKNPQPTAGLGRGMVFASDSFKENRPGPTPEEINVGLHNIGRSPRRVSTNPFETPEEVFRGNISQQTYTLSAANADETDSEYGYDKAD